MSDEKKKSGGGCLACSAVILALVVGILTLGWFLQEPTATYKEGYDQGRADSWKVIDASGRQDVRDLDAIVDPVVAEKRDYIYSRGKAFGDGWVDGVKDGLRENRMTVNKETGEEER